MLTGVPRNVPADHSGDESAFNTRRDRSSGPMRAKRAEIDASIPHVDA